VRKAQVLHAVKDVHGAGGDADDPASHRGAS
jgi:hypothetical protein